VQELLAVARRFRPKAPIRTLSRMSSTRRSVPWTMRCPGYQAAHPGPPGAARPPRDPLKGPIRGLHRPRKLYCPAVLQRELRGKGRLTHAMARSRRARPATEAGVLWALMTAPQKS
jgi:hypothetical protein